MGKKARFTPSSYKEDDSALKAYSEDDIMHARAEVEREQAKKTKRLRAFNVAWAIISTVFAIISTSILLVKNWVDGVISYVILAILIVYVLVFMVLCALVYKRPDSNVSFEVYGKTIKIFKALANIAFLVLTAMTMVAMVKENGTLSLSQWAIFIANAIVATVKLVLKLASLVRFIINRHVAKNYSVQVTRYVDGSEQYKTMSDKRIEKKYK